jgi:hypothetical protein
MQLVGLIVTGITPLFLCPTLPETESGDCIIKPHAEVDCLHGVFIRVRSEVAQHPVGLAATRQDCQWLGSRL